MKRRIVWAWLLIMMLSLPATLAFADGGHGDEGTEAVADDGHGAEESNASGFAMLPLILGVGAAAVVSGGAYASDRNKFGNVQLGIIGLTVATGVLHLMLGVAGDTLLLLNGLGYLALAATLFLPLGLPDSIQRLIPIIIGVYTLITIVGYFVLHTPAQYSTLGLGNKAIEVILIMLIGAKYGQGNAA